jgi:glycine/D-amino acid oxidase-like deaminating enzyme
MSRIRVLPRDDDTNGWNRTLAPRNPSATLAGDTRADWIVVGAGLAGLAASRRLAENRPEDKVVLLEAQRVGDGASGRNSGFAIDVPHNLGATDDAALEASRRSMGLARAAIAYLEENVKRHDISCQWNRRGQALAAVSGEGEAKLEHFTEELDALGEPYRALDSKETSRAFGTEYYRSAVRTPGTVLVQPVALVRGLAETLPGNVSLHEESPVVEVEHGDGVRVRTPKGSVKAPKIILAVNGLVPQFGCYGQRVFVLTLFASMTRQLTGEQRRALGGEDDWGILPANTFAGPTMRLTHDNRLLFRQHIVYGPAYRSHPSLHGKVRRKHEVLFRDRFPMLADVEFEHTWVGYVCMSRNSAPGFGRVNENVYTAVCQNAMGLTTGTASGMLVADLASGNDNSLIADMEAFGQPVRLPPRPFLDMGARGSLAWWTWRGRGEK